MDLAIISENVGTLNMNQDSVAGFFLVGVMEMRTISVLSMSAKKDVDEAFLQSLHRNLNSKQVKYFSCHVLENMQSERLLELKEWFKVFSCFLCASFRIISYSIMLQLLYVDCPLLCRIH